MASARILLFVAGLALAFPVFVLADERVVPIEGGTIRLKDVGVGTGRKVAITLERRNLPEKSIAVSNAIVRDADIEQRIQLCSICLPDSTIIILIATAKQDSSSFSLSSPEPRFNTKMVVLDGDGFHLIPIENANLSTQRGDGVTPISVKIDQLPIELEWIGGKLYRQINSASDLISDSNAKQDELKVNAPEELPPGGNWSVHGDWIVSMSPFPPYNCNASTVSYSEGGGLGMILELDRDQDSPWIFIGSDRWTDFRVGAYKVDYIVDGVATVEGGMDFVPRVSDFVERLGGFSAQVDFSGFARVVKSLSSGNKSLRIRTYDVAPGRRVFTSGDVSLKGSTAALRELEVCQRAEGIMLKSIAGPMAFSSFLGWD